MLCVYEFVYKFVYAMSFCYHGVMDDKKLNSIKKAIDKIDDQESTTKVLSFRVDKETHDKLDKIIKKGKFKSKSKLLKFIVTNEINKIFNK